MIKEKKTPHSPLGRLVEVDGIQYQLIGGKLCRYADLTMDKGFKIVLGQAGSEDVLKHLLNRMLGTKISWLEYRNTEHPGMTEDERSSRFDVYCEDEDGSCFQVEMQNWSQKFFNKRAVYYSSLILQDQAVKAQRQAKQKLFKWDYDFKPLYVVSFLNFKNWTAENLGEKRNEYISIYRYSDIETRNELGDGTNLVFIDLYRFAKSIEECESLDEIWLYSIKNMFSLGYCPEEVKGTEIEDLFIRSELAKMTKEQRIKYEEEVMTRNDILNSIAEQLEDARKEATEIGRAEGMAVGLAEGREKGREEGREEGRKEGREEGREEGRAKTMEIARRLIADGMSVEKVADITGIDVSDLTKA